MSVPAYGSLREHLGRLVSFPDFRAAFADALRRGPMPTLPAIALEAPPATAPPPIVRAAREALVEWLIDGLSIDEEARVVAASVLSPEEIAAVERHASLLSPVQKAHVARTLRLADDFPLGAPLERLFAGALALPPPKAAGTTADAVAELLSRPGRALTAPTGLRFAVLRSGEYRPELDVHLAALGVDVLRIDAPSPDELASWTREQGYFLRPLSVQWVARAAPPADFAADFGTGARRTWRKKLADSAGFRLSVEPLDEAAFTRWHRLYREHIVGGAKAPAGRRWPGREIFTEGFAAEQEARGVSHLWRLFSYFEPEEGAFAGGALVVDDVATGILTVGGLVFAPEYRASGIATRVIADVLELACANETSFIGYGVDANLYGYGLSPGLLMHKAEVGFTAFPHGPFELLKVIRADRFAAEPPDAQGARPGLVFFSVVERSPLMQRYVEERGRGRTPDGRELLRGAPRFSAEALAPAANLEVIRLHFPGETTSLRAPRGFELRDRVLHETA